MTDDPLRRYAALLEDAHAPEHLSHDVLEKIARERAAEPEPLAPAWPVPAPRPHGFSIKRRRFRSIALAACLALLALVVGASLAMPRLLSTNAALDFVVKAYGASGASLANLADEGRIVFEADTLARVPAESRYAEEGVYTGCLLRIEGTDIVRVRAHLNKGELYRYTYDEFLVSSDPDRWAEALAWNTSLIGQGERFGAFDLVQPSATNSGPTASGDQLVGVKCFQRLGSTVDLPVRDQDGFRLADYCLGFWTNEDVGGMGSYQDYLDTLDGATLTLTIEKADGSVATKVIELASADVKAKMLRGDERRQYDLEITSEIVDPLEMTAQEEMDNRRLGYTWVHTLLGTVVEESREPFPYGGATYPVLNAPVTRPAVEGEVAPGGESEGAGAGEGESEPARFEVPEAAPEDVNDSWVYCRNLLVPGELLDVRFYQDYGSHTGADMNIATADGTMTCGNVQIGGALPEGVALADLAGFHGNLTSARDDLQQAFGVGIADDGSLSSGFSYATVEVTMTNTSTEPFDANLADGRFGVMRRLGNEQFFACGGSTGALWVVGLPPAATDWGFARVLPGETKTYTVVHIVSNEEAADPAFAYYYDNTRYRGRMTAAYYLGPAA